MDVTETFTPAQVYDRYQGYQALMTTHPPTVPRTFTTTDPRAQTRRCYVCGERKNLDDFHRNRSDQMFDREFRCKACTSLRGRGLRPA